jgi:D-beta-D-heptose 7-phosphate kinase/D-beta-D-heptose 1-phosphate adenosyltransferase
MLLSTGGKILKTIPTAAREVYDVSGAGDTALAALVLALAAKASLVTAAHFANAAAGVVVGKLGTATVTPAELKAYVSHR